MTPELIRFLEALAIARKAYARIEERTREDYEASRERIDLRGLLPSLVRLTNELTRRHNCQDLAETTEALEEAQEYLVDALDRHFAPEGAACMIDKALLGYVLAFEKMEFDLAVLSEATGLDEFFELFPSPSVQMIGAAYAIPGQPLPLEDLSDDLRARVEALYLWKQGEISWRDTLCGWLDQLNADTREHQSEYDRGVQKHVADALDVIKQVAKQWSGMNDLQPQARAGGLRP